MAHMIENNQLAYKNATPWHGLGFAVPDSATGAEMLTIAGLDWRVQRRQLAMRDSAGDKSRMLTAELEDFRAIVRADTNEVFQVASNRYQPVQNSEIVDFFREYCDAGHASMETVGGLRGGAVVWALAKLNGGSGATLAGGDELRGYMLLATSHDGSLKTIGKPTQVRVVCHNTLTAAVSDKSAATFTMRHTRKFGTEDKAQAARVMGMASQQVAETNDLAAKLAAVTISHDDWMDYMGKLLGTEGLLDIKTAELTTKAAAIQEATMVSPGSNLLSARGTLWGAINGVTWYVDHAARSRSDANRLFAGWFGAGDNLKTRAMEVAREMAGV